MTLFEDKERNSTGPRSRTEREYEYLDRSSRPEAERVRSLLNDWIAKFPKEDADELRSRMVKGDDKAFTSAIFEILLFAFLNSMGFEVEVHPDLENDSGKRPDFRAVDADGNETIIEAVLASEHSAEEIAAERRRQVVLEALEKLDSPDFYLSVDAEGNPDTPPPSKPLRRHLSAWLSRLDPDEVIASLDENGRGQLPKTTWSFDGWLMEFEAIPISPHKRGREKRIIGAESSGVRWRNIWIPIRDSVRAKGGRYGEPKRAFVVAVNVDEYALDRIDEMQALFGEEEYVVFPDSDREPEMRRARNGVWLGPDGPQYTRVSGVWLFGALNAWNIVSRRDTLYLNPWAQYQLPSVFLTVNHAEAYDDGRVEWKDGVGLAELLKLEDSWPE